MDEIFRLKTDGFHGQLFLPDQDHFPGKVLVCFTGSDGSFELAKKIARSFQARGLTTLAFAYVGEEGLPEEFYHIPVDMVENAAGRLREAGYRRVGLWGVSKGAELALIAGSLVPDLIGGVVAVAPMCLACQGFSVRRGISFAPGSTWTFHGEEIPYARFTQTKFPFGSVLRKSLLALEPTMFDLYGPLLDHPDPEAVIRVENIAGPVLLISSKSDVMWPSERAAARIMERLEERRFAYPRRHLSYDYGGHLLIPVETTRAS